MLSLTRRIGESVYLFTKEGEIQVSISQIKGNQVKIKFSAPQSIDIVRSEIRGKDK